MMKLLEAFTMWVLFLLWLTNSACVVIALFCWSFIALVGFAASWMLILILSAAYANRYREKYISPRLKGM